VGRLAIVGAGLLAGMLAALPLAALERGVVEYDDCEADFVAFVGSEGYQFSPLHGPALGRVRLFAIFSYQRGIALGEHGQAYWRLSVRPLEADATVFVRRGSVSLTAPRGAALAEAFWDGLDGAGQPLPSGRYRYTFEARFVPDGAKHVTRSPSFETLAGLPGVIEARPASDEVALDLDLSRAEAEQRRASAQLTSCEIQQNAPLEAGLGFNFYYGSTHSHSNYSDGGQPTGACSSGNAYGSGNFTPGAVYDYAHTSAGLDFWVINEHNHLINDSVATNNAPVSEAKVRQRYQDGRAAADAATVNDEFVAIYGMEWGVTTNADQGHVTLLDTPVLFGWETCTGCNGPSQECTPGSTCYFDVFTPKRFGYLTLYRRSLENPSTAGALGILAHPSSGNFDNFAFNADADAALQGIAVRSGLAFSTAADCANANVGATDYVPRWLEALDKGFHLGPVADHDSHCNNYGQGLPTRTVYLLPNGNVPTLTRSALLQAHKARHFFASEDPNAQLVFRTLDGTHSMGDIFNAAGGSTLHLALYDPGAEGVARLELWRGQSGAGAPTAPYRTFTGVGSATWTEALTSGTYYYFLHAVQADGHDLWSAPMWITYTPAGDTQAPTTALTAPSAGSTLSGTITVSASATDNVGVSAVDFYLDGVFKSTDSSAPYAWSWDTTGSANGSHALQSRARDAAGNVGSSASVAVTVSNSAGTDVSGWKLVQANSAITFTLPAGSVIPANGYLIVARDATKAAFETFWRGGTALPAGTVYVNAAGAFPAINGSETYTLTNAASVTIDGPTIATATSANQSLRRKDPCQAAGLAASWNVGATSTATPASGAGVGCAKGVVINEFSDAAGTGNFVYEFVELHNDR
jgi:hypothetical protein